MQTTAEGLVQECKAVLGQHRELVKEVGWGGSESSIPKAGFIGVLICCTQCVYFVSKHRVPHLV